MVVLVRNFSLNLCYFIILFFLSHCQSHHSDMEISQAAKQLLLADSINYFNPKAADSIYRMVISDSAKNSQNDFVKALLGLSSVYSNRSAFDSATIFVNKAFKIAESLNDTTLIMSCLLEKGNLTLSLGDHKQSEQCFKKGLTLAILRKNSNFQNRFFLGLGNEQIDRGDYPVAGKTFTEAIKIAEKSGDEKNVALGLENLAITLKFSGEIREAIKYNKQALQIRKKLNLLRDYASGLQNLGILYRNLEITDSALICYRQAYTIFLELNDSLSIVRVRYNIGVILKNQKKFREAEDEMKSILQFCQQRNIIEGQIYSLSTLASIYNQTNRTEEGLVAIDSAIIKAKRIHLYANLSILYDRQHEVLANLGHFKEAYMAALASHNLSDSLLSIDKQKEITALKTRFETERKEAENVLLKKDLEFQKSRMWLLRVGLLLASLIFVLLITLLYFRHRYVKHQKQLAEEKSLRMEQEKRNKEQELVFQSLVQADLIQINRSVKEKLFPFKLKLPRKNQQDEFEQVLNGLTRDAGKDPLAEFELLFRQLHASFYDNILHICPVLTKAELHVCAMIRLNLSTKDIARLTNININSIEMTRYHIRKKLKMEQGDNLAAFLMRV
jgi:tetratricopeptide (TPR) repeat protein/DNA-binding CsgD family transcriptional regulator